MSWLTWRESRAKRTVERRNRGDPGLPFPGGPPAQRTGNGNARRPGPGGSPAGRDPSGPGPMGAGGGGVPSLRRRRSREGARLPVRGSLSGNVPGLAPLARHAVPRPHRMALGGAPGHGALGQPAAVPPGYPARYPGGGMDRPGRRRGRACPPGPPSRWPPPDPGAPGCRDGWAPPGPWRTVCWPSREAWESPRPGPHGPLNRESRWVGIAAARPGAAASADGGTDPDAGESGGFAQSVAWSSGSWSSRASFLWRGGDYSGDRPAPLSLDCRHGSWSARLYTGDIRDPGSYLRAEARQAWKAGGRLKVEQEIRLPWTREGLAADMGYQLRLEAAL